MGKVIEIPADAKTVTMELKKQCTFTLRALLPKIESGVELVVVDEFGNGPDSDADLYRLRANSGDALMNKLARSRVVEGEFLLDLTPIVTVAEPQAVLDDMFGALPAARCIQLAVWPPVPDEKD